VTTFWTTPGFTDERIHIYVATGLEEGNSSLEADEILDLHPTPLSRALQMIDSGEITDGKSMIGILLAASRIRS
jgi:ADP-ribose pyrophosphatase